MCEMIFLLGSFLNDETRLILASFKMFKNGAAHETVRATF